MLEPETLVEAHAQLAQLTHVVAAISEDSVAHTRRAALVAMRRLEPAALAQLADAVAARLEDSDEFVRLDALLTLGKLEPATLAQHADAVVAQLEASEWEVRRMALHVLGTLEPATLAQYAGAVVARLEDGQDDDQVLQPFVRLDALRTLGKLEPATLAQHAEAVAARLEDSHEIVIDDAEDTLRALPRFIIRGVDFESDDLRSRLLGRLGWYRCRLRLRVNRLALYWYALPYRPTGPGHARDVEAWARMSGNQGQRERRARKRANKKDRDAATGQNMSNISTRRRERNTKRRDLDAATEQNKAKDQAKKRQQGKKSNKRKK